MQNKILLSIFIFLVGTTVHAQIKKGAVLLGGGIEFSTQDTKSSGPQNGTSSGINFSPAFGKAIKENEIIGADLTFSYSKNESNNTYSQKTSSYGIGFFIRKYKELGKGFYLFGQTRAGVSYNKVQNRDQQTPTTSYVSKGYGMQVTIYPGLAYAVSKKLQLEAGLSNLAYIQFNHMQTAYDLNTYPSLTTNNFSLGSSLSNLAGLTVGFRVLLN
ncbi:MAG: hypothetical protein ABJB86_08325 [Bacteroidota bacterium]